MYVVIWEFRVKPGQEAAFRQAYGPEGPWVRLFGQGIGYLGTELLHDASDVRRYLTLDRWSSQAAYETFRGGRAEEYRALDQACEALTEDETLVGSYARVTD